MLNEINSILSLKIVDEATGWALQEIDLNEAQLCQLPKGVRDLALTLAIGDSEVIDVTRVGSLVTPSDLDSWGNCSLKLSRRGTSGLSYKIHGGCELEMMLNGEKPLAFFIDLKRDANLRQFLLDRFDPHVRSGRFVQRVAPEDLDEDMVLYALASESWRIDAFLLIRKVFQLERPWNFTFERIEGLLLGYSEAQGDEWKKYRSERGLKWGMQFFWKAISDVEENFIEETGHKAFPRDNSTSDSVFFLFYADALSNKLHHEILAEGVPERRVARFYAPAMRLREFRKHPVVPLVTQFEAYTVPRDQISKVNSLIDGKIEVLSLPTP